MATKTHREAALQIDLDRDRQDEYDALSDEEKARLAEAQDEALQRFLARQKRIIDEEAARYHAVEHNEPEPEEKDE